MSRARHLPAAQKSFWDFHGNGERVSWLIFISKSGLFHPLLSEWIRSREQRAIVESFGEFLRSVNGHATSENPSKTCSAMKSEKQSEFKLCQTVGRCFSDFFDAALGIHCTSANQITWNFCCHSSQTSFRDYREYFFRYFLKMRNLIKRLQQTTPKWCVVYETYRPRDC